MKKLQEVWSSMNHGIRVEEKATQLSAPVVTTGGVQVVFGIAPVNLLDDPTSATNILILCSTFDEAKQKFGYSNDTIYTLCQSMDANFKLFAVAPVVFCNILDPNAHKKTNASVSKTIANNKVTLDIKGILLSSITVTAESSETAMTDGTDYVSSFNDEGGVIITFLNSQTGSVTVTSDSIDPTLVTAYDVIGGIDQITGAETGLELVRQVYPRFGLFPGLILAPGFSTDGNVATAIANKCEQINGKFRCECLVDIDTTTARQYTDVANVKTTAFMNNEHMICLWPQLKQSDGRIFYYSAVYAALIDYYDYQNDSVPTSYSNKILKVSGAVLKDGTEIMLDEIQANVLNENGIVTAINQAGWRSWGNYTACFPTDNDPKNQWIMCRRMFSWYGNSFIVTYREKVDDPMNFRLIESVVDSENIRSNSYVPDKMAGAKITYSKSENPIENILKGTIVFHIAIAPYTPAQFIQATLEFDPVLLETALSSGGEE